MPIDTNTITAGTVEAGRQEEIRRLLEETPHAQPHNFAASFTIATVPQTVWSLPNPVEGLVQSLRLHFNAEAIARFWREVSESQAVGLRHMRLSPEDVAELRRHDERPTAKPRLPLRSAQMEDVDQLD